mgnify:FL=1
MAQLKGSDRSRYVSNMFSAIAKRYDLLNTIISMGQHWIWRRKTISISAADISGRVLDVATGTGDMAILLSKNPKFTSIIGLDFTPEMISIARKKSKPVNNKLSYLVADSHNLPFPPSTFNLVTVAFGVRNFIDIDKALSEIKQALCKGGKITILEIVKNPSESPLTKLFGYYFKNVVPLFGLIFAGNKSAYKYLPESVGSFITRDEIVRLMKKSGFSNITTQSMSFGSVAIISGEKCEEQF